MKKAHFFLPALMLFFLSCDKTDKKIGMASGDINRISVIIDDALWNGELGDSIRNKFASPVTGLPQEEPLFTIDQYPVKLLEGFMTDSRNIIVVKKQPGNNFRIIRNQFAKPQNVIHISGTTVGEIRDVLENHAPEMVQMMRQAEISEIQKRIDSALLDDKPVTEKFGVTLKIPSGYKYALDGDRFLWLKKDIISGNMNLLIYEVPIKCLAKNSNTIRNIVTMRDSIGARYIHGTVPDSKMITEEAYTPYLAQVTIEGRKTYETKGTWELKNDFMSGPFINYAIIDKARKRIVVLEGFCYAPSKEKRDLVLELEAIIKSIGFEN